ncbi:MAG: hypothetical protein KGZ71_01365 [Desulfobulbaceae bacterium]|nr:hypothetical protein [Desulfobulbaceae bacterium]
MRSFIALALVMALLFLMSCSDSPIGLDDNLKKTVNENVLLPLELNNKWTYRVTEYDEFGNVTQTTNSVYSIISVFQLDNQIWYRLFDENSNLTEMTVTNFDDGVWVAKTNVQSEISKSEKELLFKYPALNGQQYIVKAKDESNGDYFARFVVEIDSKLSIDQTDYQTYFYRDEKRDANANILYHPFADYYIAPNFGIVKIIYYEIDKGGNHYPKQVFELIDADLI